jgi:uncharacterized protein (DUF2249 family)
MTLVTLDVRPILAAGGEPFETIMAAINDLPDGDALELTAPFDPVPLYAVLGAQGFAHRTEQRGPAEFVVRFSRTSANLHE